MATASAARSGPRAHRRYHRAGWATPRALVVEGPADPNGRADLEAIGCRAAIAGSAT